MLRAACTFLVLSACLGIVPGAPAFDIGAMFLGIAESFWNTLVKFSDESVEQDVFFWVYTAQNKNAYQLWKNDTEGMKKSSFNKSMPTKVLIHGWLNDLKSPMPALLLEAYLYKGGVNVIVVDWTKISYKDYFTASSLTKSVGMEVIQLLKALVEVFGVPMSSFHMIGFSLGAHVCGFAGREAGPNLIGRITGLEMATPGFGNRPPAMSLEKTDALHVDCIHTDIGFISIHNPICTTDFYVNGGAGYQPGCDFQLGCSHGRSFELMASSVNHTFLAKSCDSLDHVMKKACTGTTTAHMGESASSGDSGIYYMETEDKYPYVK